jgi:PTS system nitrogen regulatory IIA component
MQLTVRDAAQLLNTSEKQVYRWVDDGQIPFYRSNDQLRFNRAELLEWATARRIPVSVDAFHEAGAQRPAGLVEAITAGGVHHLAAVPDREGLLRAVVDVMPLPAQLDRDFLAQILLAREAMGSTGIGEGIAIPHVRNPVVLNGAPASITVCYLDLERPIEFGAIDGQPVHTLFSMISPTIHGHLQLLARLSRALHDPAFKAVVLRRGSLDELRTEAARVEASFTRAGAGAKR